MPIWAIYTLLGGAGLWTLGSIEKGVEKGTQDATNRLLIGAGIVLLVYFLMKQKGGK